MKSTADLHAEGFAHEGALHLLPLNAQGGEGCVLAIALVVIDEVLHDGSGYDVPNIFCILVLQSHTFSMSQIGTTS